MSSRPVFVLLPLVLLVFSLASLAVVAGPGPVIFADPNLEAVVRQALDKPEWSIYPKDMAGLLVLDASKRAISDLSGLEHAEALRELRLNLNPELADISPLAGLAVLETLQLSYNQVSDLSPLAGLSNLRVLHLCSNGIDDLSALSELADLNTLYLRYNRVSDISALAGLTGLTSLHLTGNRVADIGPLVTNSDAGGLGPGHEVDLRNNYLDLTPDSAATAVLDLLQSRGVQVTYVPQDAPPPFLDVEDELLPAVELLNSLRVMRGHADGGFHPDQLFSREQLATVAVRLECLEPEADLNAGQPASMYHDSPAASHWSSGYLITAYQHQLMRGDSPDALGHRLFRPFAAASLDEVLTITIRVLLGERLTGAWPDVYRARAVELGLMATMAARLELQQQQVVVQLGGQPASRGEIAEILYTALTETEQGQDLAEVLEAAAD